MLTAPARRLADALRRLVDDTFRAGLGGAALSTRDRLHELLIRHLPVKGADKGSKHSPPMLVEHLARKSGLDRDQAIGLAVAAACYFSAADLADDIADGDLGHDVALPVTDVCRLVFLYQRAIMIIPGIDHGQRIRLLDLFASRGIDMCDGQELDLRGTNAIEASPPLTMIRHKSGAELGALAASVALVRGVDPEPWLTWGTAFGTTAQMVSDYADLFMDPDSDDWAAGKPTRPIRQAVEHPEHGEAVRRLMAGDRARDARQGAGLWHVVQSDVASTLEADLDTLEAELNAAAARTDSAKVLIGRQAPLLDMGRAIAAALREYANDPPPPCPTIAEELPAVVARLTSAVRRTLSAQPAGGDMAWALALDAGAAAGLRLDAPLSVALDAAARAEGDREADRTAFLIRAAARGGSRSHPALPGLVAVMMANTRRDGLTYRWLYQGRLHRDDALGEARGGEVSALATAALAWGLWLMDDTEHRVAVARSATVLADRVHDAAWLDACSSLGRSATQAMIIDTLFTVRNALNGRRRAKVEEAIEHTARALGRAQRLDGRFGDPLSTAVVAATLHRVGADFHRPAAARALLDAVEGPFNAAGPSTSLAQPGSVLSLTYALRAIAALENHVGH